MLTRESNIASIPRRRSSAQCACAAISPPPTRVGANAVWTPSPGVLSDIRQVCSAGDPGQQKACFLDSMKSAGASDEAAAFVKSFAANGLAYVRAFRDTGRVDIAYIEYLFRANELDGVLLVNGTPPIIDVDDDKLVSQEDFRSNADMAALTQQHPRNSIWPGDRYHTDWPKAISSPTGQKFEVNYFLLDGCHACARIGTAVMAFHFDSFGRFTGARLADVETGGDNDRPALSKRPDPKASNCKPKEVALDPTEVHSKVGASFTIALPANHTTGYSWRLAKPLNPELLRQVSDIYNEKSSGRIGRGGEEVWMFEALTTGTTELNFEYARPFEKDAAPVNTAKFHIEIK